MRSRDQANISTFFLGIGIFVERQASTAFSCGEGIERVSVHGIVLYLGSKKALSQSVFALSSSNDRVRGSNFSLEGRYEVQSVLSVSEDGLVHGIKFILICFLPIPA